MSSENSEITDDSKQGPAHVSENAENMSEAVKTDLKGEQGDEGVNIAVEEKGAECDKVAAEQEGGIEEPMAKLLLESEATEAAENEAPAAAAENKDAASAAVQPTPNVEAIDAVKKILFEQPESRVIITNKSSASLNNLLVYASSSEEESDDDDDEDDDDDDDEDIDGVSQTSKSNVLIIDSSSSSCGSTELLNELESSSSLSDEEEELSVPKTIKIDSLKKPENKFGDYIGKDTQPLPIPDISKLTINVESKDLFQIGKVSAMVDEFVMVEANPGLPPYNLDTFMFLEDCTFLGAVFDVMGPVNAPIYVIRFKSSVDAAKLKLSVGVSVFVSPKGEHTKYVFLRDLLSVKGSDASWVGDVEVPEEFEDFSDDEKESKKKAGLKGGSRKRGSLERHKNFEHKMNKKNTMDTVCQIAQSQGGPSRTPHSHQHLPPPLAVPAFDPRRPPPPPPQHYHGFPPFQGAGFQGNWGFGHPQPPGL